MISDATVPLGAFINFSNGRSSPERHDDAPFAVFGSNGIIGRALEKNASASTIVIGRVGTYCGSLHYSRAPCWVTDNAIKAVARQDNDPLYLFYLLSTLRLNDRRAGSGQPLLNQQILSTIPVLAHHPEEQAAIAAILSALDDKIELNRQMNETLEASARSLFRDWFVDFGPTRAKAEGRPPYLAPDLWSLFPDRLGDDDVPEGWALSTLGDIARGVNLKVEPSAIDPDTPYIGLEHMPRRSIALADWEGAGKVTSAKSGFKAGQILFGKLRPYFHKVGLAPVDGICSTDIVVMEVRHARNAALLLACVSSDELVEFTNQGSTGTKMPRTSWPMMSRYTMSTPVPAIAERYQSIAGPRFEQIIANIQESRALVD